MGRKHFQGADGIRGLACLIVLVLHSVAFSFPEMTPYFQGIPKTGVWLFFVLSAFLLTAHLIASGTGRAALADYAVGRFLRIYPLYALAVVVYYLAGHLQIETPRDVWLALTLQGGYVQLWTIPVEFKFYAALPLIVIVARAIYGRSGIAGLLAATAVFTVAHQVAFPYSMLTKNEVSTLPYLPAFLFGVVAAFAHVHGHDTWIRRNGSWIAPAILAGIVLVSPLSRFALLGIEPSGYLTNKFLFFSLAWAVFICAQADTSGWTGKLLAGRALTALGKWSYSIYIVHVLVMILLVTRLSGSWAVSVAGIVASVAVGAWIYRSMEVPLLSARRWVMARLAPPHANDPSCAGSGTGRLQDERSKT